MIYFLQGEVFTKEREKKIKSIMDKFKMAKNVAILKPSFDKMIDKREVIDNFLYDNIDTIYLFDSFGEVFNIAGRICIKNRYYAKYYYFTFILLEEELAPQLIVMTDPNIYLPLIFIKANIDDENNDAFIISYASVSGNKQIIHHPSLYIHAINTNMRENNIRRLSLGKDAYGDINFYESLKQFFELHDNGFVSI